MMPSETGSSLTGSDLNHTPMGADTCRTSTRKRLSQRKMGNLTCHEGEVEDLLSEGEST